MLLWETRFFAALRMTALADSPRSFATPPCAGILNSGSSCGSMAVSEGNARVRKEGTARRGSRQETICHALPDGLRNLRCHRHNACRLPEARYDHECRNLHIVGLRAGEQIILDATEFRVGSEPNCEIFFDPQQDLPAKGRLALFRLMDDGWYLTCKGIGELLVNETVVSGRARESARATCCGCPPKGRISASPLSLARRPAPLHRASIRCAAGGSNLAAFRGCVGSNRARRR